MYMYSSHVQIPGLSLKYGGLTAEIFTKQVSKIYGQHKTVVFD